MDRRIEEKKLKNVVHEVIQMKSLLYIFFISPGFTQLKEIY